MTKLEQRKIKESSSKMEEVIDTSTKKSKNNERFCSRKDFSPSIKKEESTSLLSKNKTTIFGKSENLVEEEKSNQNMDGSYNILPSKKSVSSPTNKSHVKESYETQDLHLSEDMNKPDCTICFSKIDFQDIYLLECQHMYHPECMESYIKVKIESKDFPINCPEFKCKNQLTEEDVKFF